MEVVTTSYAYLNQGKGIVLSVGVCVRLIKRIVKHPQLTTTTQGLHAAAKATTNNLEHLDLATVTAIIEPSVKIFSLITDIPSSAYLRYTWHMAMLTLHTLYRDTSINQQLIIIAIAWPTFQPNTSLVFAVIKTKASGGNIKND